MFNEKNSKINMKTDKAYVAALPENYAALVFSAPDGIMGSGTAMWAAERLALMEPNVSGVLITTESSDFCSGANVEEIQGLAGKREWDRLNDLTLRFQSLTTTIRNYKKPVVIAIKGKALDFGTELALASPNLIAADDVVMGFQTVRNGFSPMGGGLASLVLGAYALVDGVPGHDIIPFLKRAFFLAYSGIVSADAADAKDKGFIKRDVAVVPAEKIVEKGLKLLKCLAELGQAQGAADSKPIIASGMTGKAALDAMTMNAELGGFLSSKALGTASWISWVLCGGDVPKKAELPRERFWELERKAFIQTCKLLNE